MKYSFVYLLIYPGKNLLKIGKADDVVARYQILKKSWGEADLKNSYCIKVNRQDVLKLEKTLHYRFSEFCIDQQQGDGKREFFNLDILDDVLEFINTWGIFEIQKDLSFEEFKQNKMNKPYKNIAKVDKLIKQRQKLIKNINADLQIFQDKIVYLNRCISILLKYQGKIAYAWEKDAESNIYCFAILVSEKRQDRLSEVISDLLRFRLMNYGVNVSTSCLMHYDGLLEFNSIAPCRISGESRSEIILSNLWECLEVEKFFLKLPSRSRLFLDRYPDFQFEKR